MRAKKHLRGKKLTYLLICAFCVFCSFAWLCFCAFGALGAFGTCKIFSYKKVKSLKLL